MSTVSARMGDRATEGVRWLRDRLAPTPGRLILAAVVLTVAAALFGLVVATSTDGRRAAAESAATETEPLLVEAAGLYGSLSGADATAATTFLTGGIEPRARRRRYLANLRSGSSRLTTLTRQVQGPPDARAAVLKVARLLPRYAGLIEIARANNRQGRPVGAAYLRQASTLMREEILPAAKQVYALEARRLERDYRKGTGAGAFVAVALAAALLLALLAATQVFLARHTHRVFNIPIAVATGLIVLLSGWILIGFTVEGSALGSARSEGSDSVQVLSAMRILALRAQADESLALVARGGGAQYLADFDAVMRVLEPTKGEGLADEAVRLARRSGRSAEASELVTTLTRYRRQHARIAALEADGDFDSAIQRAVGRGARGPRVAEDLNANLDGQIAAAQRRFVSEAADARSALSGLWLGIPLLVVAVVTLILIGLRPRIGEYR